MPRVVYLSEEIVIAINRQVVQRTQENHLLRDRDRLASILARAPNAARYEGADLATQGAKLIEGLARAQVFENGNKRTAMQAGLLFFRYNGYILLFQELEFAHQILELISRIEARDPRALDFFLTWLRRRIFPIDSETL